MGVVLPLISGFALQMPRAGLVVASGALNVSYSDGSDSYAGRSRRMLASSVICAIAVFAGAISGQHQFVAIVLATAWAFIAGMSYALGGAAPDLGAISLVTLLIYAAQPLTPRQAAASGVLSGADYCRPRYPSPCGRYAVTSRSGAPWQSFTWSSPIVPPRP
jgi:uncharacterized membrane protein YccC